MQGQIGKILRRSALACLTAAIGSASEYHGRVTFGNLPVPGATVTLTQNGQVLHAISDANGFYTFPQLADGAWKMIIKMRGFAPLSHSVLVTPETPAGSWELQMLPLDQIQTVKNAPAIIPAPQADQQKSPKKKLAANNPAPTAPQNTDDGFLINGSLNNGAASPFSQSSAFGNGRGGGRGVYNGLLGVMLDNSVFDARPFSLTGQETPKASYNRLRGLLELGGPIRIPHLLKRGPEFTLTYQWTRNRNASTQSALMPTAAERHGDLGAIQVPVSRISPQARALLSFYPLPNAPFGAGYNYQLPLVDSQHQDALQFRLNHSLSQHDTLNGRFALQSTRSDTPNIFQFLDTSELLGLSTNINCAHRFTQDLFLNAGYQFSRLSIRTDPFFANRVNISGAAGIRGNNQEPANWGPPTLAFSSGIAGLSDQQSAFNRNETNGVTAALLYNRNDHNILFGAGFRRQQFNYRSQQDPRGTFTFTGASAGSDFADFLTGVPDTSSIAYGNADKYLRESVYDAYITDDWRVNPALTVNAGIRWDYEAPITELYGRLANLAIAPGFTAASVVTGNSLIHPYRNGFEPRIGLAWRPLSGSSLVIRAGYGIYYDTSTYNSIATILAQQPPFSRTLRVENSAANPLNLANGFTGTSALTNTFAIDPNFKVGYAQNWQVTAQRDLPGSLQLTAAYIGIKGTHAAQDFLPNTYPQGALNPCPLCPVGFEYYASNANSSRQAGQFQLRRRLRSGLTALVQYTFSKSIDDAAVLGGSGSAAGQSGNQSVTGGNESSPSNSGSMSSRGSGFAGPVSSPSVIAQNWLNLAAERGLSSFDQRHAATVQIQYTTGMGLHGGIFASGWRAAVLNEWTIATDISAGSGLPLTPIYLSAVPGTGVTGSIRPNYTGAPLYATPSGQFVNPAAFVAPAPGQWGNAGRNTITGPSQFLLNASIGRTFRLTDRFNLDMRIDSTNALNRVNFTIWNTIIGSPQFGLPASAQPMRSIQTILRLRF